MKITFEEQSQEGRLHLSWRLLVSRPEEEDPEDDVEFKVEVP